MTEIAVAVAVFLVLLGGRSALHRPSSSAGQAHKWRKVGWAMVFVGAAMVCVSGIALVVR
jgi:hypothetical protein